MSHRLTLIRNCSAALPPAIGARLEAALHGAVVVPTYAMTEALPICSNPRSAASRDLTSVGPAAGPEVALLREHEGGAEAAEVEIFVVSDSSFAAPGGSARGSLQPAALAVAGQRGDEEGEVVVRGRCVFGGYEQRAHLGHDPNVNAFADGGWLRTGDRGWIDESGHLHLTGRFKEIINRAGEKISPLAIEHTLLAACGAADAIASSSTAAVSAAAPAAAARADGGGGGGKHQAGGELRGWVRGLLAFAAPHEELGEVVGIAVTCESGKTPTLQMLRRAGTRGGLGRPWLPELLVLVPTLPKGPTGKPKRIGLAQALGIPMLRLSTGMQTVDLRSGQPKEFEAARRADARRAAAQRAGARKSGIDVADSSLANSGAASERSGNRPMDKSVAVRAPHSSLDSIGDCVSMVRSAFLQATGEEVGENDDLFDAGLASITAARFEELIEKVSGLTLPPSLVYDSPNVQALAAAVFRICKSKRKAMAADHGEPAQIDVSSLPVLLDEAALCLREGQLRQAEEHCKRALALTGLAERAVQRVEGDIAFDVTADDVPLLSLLVAVQTRLESWQAATQASEALFLLRSKKEAHAAPIDLSLLATQRLRLALAWGNEEAIAAATRDATEAARRTKVALSSSNGQAASNLTSSAHGDEDRNSVVESTHQPLVCLTAPTAVMQSVAQCQRCAALKTLVLARQGLDHLPEAVGQLHSLQVLDVSDNGLTSLPASLQALSELRELLLAQNELQHTAFAGLGFPQLQVLNLQANRLTELPTAVLSFAKLRHLRWGQQRIESRAPLLAASPQDAAEATEVPMFLSTSLNVLELEGNNQPCFPALSSSASLTALLASFNRLRTCPLGLARYGGSLKRLHLGGNEIASLKGVLAPLTCLVGLMVEGNRLTSLPDEIGLLTEMRELSVYGNLLTSLPDTIGRCASLMKLEANHNQLESLPEGMKTLSKLKSLYVQSNQLRGTLAALHETVLRHLPLLNIGLGANDLDLSEGTSELPGVRLGLGWNRGADPPPSLRGILTDRFATVDHLFDPSCKGVRGDVLLVAFAAQGPGMQQWVAPCAATRAAGVSLDALYLADPSNSYYLQDPTGEWHGIQYYDQLVREHAMNYSKVLMIGSSMGGTAALVHAKLATRVISFGPKTELERCHGSFLPEGARRACHEAIVANTARSQSRSITIHVGSGNLEDVLQAERVAQRTPPTQLHSSSPSILITASSPSRVSCASIIEHDTFHHNVPMYLEREGMLVGLFKSECEALLRPELVQLD